jgi:hypothetical protein
MSPLYIHVAVSGLRTITAGSFLVKDVEDAHPQHEHHHHEFFDDVYHMFDVSFAILLTMCYRVV